MSLAALTPETRRAILQCVRSAEELEVLLFLSRDRDRYSSPVTIAGEIGMPTASVAGALEALAARNLLDVRIGEHVLYRLDPGSSGMGKAVDVTVKIGWQSRSAVMRVIVSAGPSAVSDFADSFRLGKEDGDG